MEFVNKMFAGKKAAEIIYVGFLIGVVFGTFFGVLFRVQFASQTPETPYIEAMNEQGQIERITLTQAMADVERQIQAIDMKVSDGVNVMVGVTNASGTTEQVPLDIALGELQSQLAKTNQLLEQTTFQVLFQGAPGRCEIAGGQWNPQDGRCYAMQPVE